MENKKIAAFRRAVWKYYRAHGRHDLPWRKTTDPYKILVSEIMLQQTQVSRVIEKYKEFLKSFPSVRALARAPLSEVLRVWSGMGYNRRAKYLREAAKEIVEKQKGRVPFVYSELVELPGVGSYTASAVRVFAFNEPDVFLETNIRAAYIDHFSKIWVYETQISDKQILRIAAKAAEGQDPRTWHWALMDYGSYLKKSGVRNNHRSAHYMKQPTFEGSLRQVRGEILRRLMKGESGIQPFDKQRVKKKWEKGLEGLARDGLIENKKGKWRIA
jgi:A/G-specific adenine glycosylase